MGGYDEGDGESRGGLQGRRDTPRHAATGRRLDRFPADADIDADGDETGSCHVDARRGGSREYPHVGSPGRSADGDGGGHFTPAIDAGGEGTGGSALTDRLGDWRGRWLPQSLRDARLDPGRRTALVTIGVAAVVAAIAAAIAWHARPSPSPVGDPPALAAPTGLLPTASNGAAATPAEPNPSSGTVGATPSSASSDQSLIVAVAGKVRRPGLVHLAAGSRVADAIRAAGGVLPGTGVGLLNLAAPLSDGEQVLVGVPVPTGSAPASGVPAGIDPAGAATFSGTVVPGPALDPGSDGGTAAGRVPGSAPGAAAKVDLNTATASELDALPGVGPVTASKILDWRASHGRFESVAQLQDIPGIGDAKFAQLKDLVTV